MCRDLGSLPWFRALPRSWCLGARPSPSSPPGPPVCAARLDFRPTLGKFEGRDAPNSPGRAIGRCCAAGFARQALFRFWASDRLKPASFWAVRAVKPVAVYRSVRGVAVVPISPWGVRPQTVSLSTPSGFGRASCGNLVAMSREAPGPVRTGPSRWGPGRVRGGHPVGWYPRSAGRSPAHRSNTPDSYGVTPALLRGLAQPSLRLPQRCRDPGHSSGGCLGLHHPCWPGPSHLHMQGSRAH